MNKARCISTVGRGFTLIELLVTMAIFMMVMIAVYSLFDGGQWFYLHGERKTKIQEITRMTLEQMERDIRMCGFGVPTGAKFGDTTKWTPNIFTATGGKFYFRADIDSGHTYVTVNLPIGTEPSSIYVLDPDAVCPNPGTSEIILVQKDKKWQPLLCTAAVTDAGNPNNNKITVAPYAPATAVESCDAEECQIYTPEHIFYRLTPDDDNDGVCDNTGPNDDPFCEIQRAVVSGNDPETDNDETLIPADDWKTIATNIISMQITSGSLVEVTITARDRSMEGPQKYQDVTLTTQILVRSDAY